MFFSAFSIFDNKLKFKFILVIFNLFIVGFVEMISIVAIPVYLTFFFKQKEIINFLPEIIINYLINLSHNELIYLSSIVLIIIFVLKNIIIFLINLYQIHFQQSVRRYISSKIFTKYLFSNYENIINSNSSVIIRNVIDDANITSSYYFQLATILTEIFVVLTLLFLLIISGSLDLIIFIFILFLVIFLFYLSIRKILEKKGKEAHSFRGNLIKICNYTFRGFREIQILSKNDFVKKIFFQMLNGEILNSTFQKKINLLPRLILEIMSIIAIIFIIYKITSKTPLDLVSVLATLSLYLVVILRFIPSINKITSSISKLRYDLPVIQNILKIIKNTDKIVQKKINYYKKFEFSKIEFRNISFKYRTRQESALIDLSLTIEKNKSHLIYGPSGSGKSTFLDILVGLIKKDKGQILVDGKEIDEINFLINDIGYVPQDPFLFEGNVLNNIAFGVAEKEVDINKVKEVLKQTNMLDFFLNLKENLQTHLGENGVFISGGQKQRVAIARALYNDPSIIIFDEPTSALDESNEENIIDTIMRLKTKRTILIVSHKIKFKEKFDFCFSFKDGKVI